jgi:hypothetical protein
LVKQWYSPVNEAGGRSDVVGSFARATLVVPFTVDNP